MCIYSTDCTFQDPSLRAVCEGVPVDCDRQDSEVQDAGGLAQTARSRACNASLTSTWTTSRLIEKSLQMYCSRICVFAPCQHSNHVHNP